MKYYCRRDTCGDSKDERICCYTCKEEKLNLRKCNGAGYANSFLTCPYIIKGEKDLVICKMLGELNV